MTDRFDEMARRLIAPVAEMAAMPIDEAPYVSAVAAALREGWEAGREAAAKVCEQPVHHQHPMKPTGVVMASTPASPAHAAAIRAMKEPTS